MATLVIGGTGFIGSAIVRELVALNVPVRATCRRGEPRAPEIAALPAEWIAADLLDPISIRYAMEGCDRVFFCAGNIDLRQRDATYIHETHVQGAKVVFQAALDAGVRRLVFTSSIFALGLGPKGGPLADESIAYNLDDLRSPYIRAKREAELLAQDYSTQGLDIITLYVGFCAGPGDRNRTSSRLLLTYINGWLPITLSGGLCQVDVRDVAHAQILAMDRGEPHGRYLITGHNVTYEQVFDELSTLTGRRRLPMTLPNAPLHPLASALEKVNHRLPLDYGTAELLRSTWWYDDSKARLELVIAYRPLVATYADTIAWFVAQGRLAPRYLERLQQAAPTPSQLDTSQSA